MHVLREIKRMAMIRDFAVGGHGSVAIFPGSNKEVHGSNEYDDCTYAHEIFCAFFHMGFLTPPPRFSFFL